MTESTSSTSPSTAPLEAPEPQTRHRERIVLRDEQAVVERRAADAEGST
jgi:hypothetical protein